MSLVLSKLLNVLACDGVAFAWSVIGGPPSVGAFTDARRAQIDDPSRNLDVKLAVAEFESRHSASHPALWELIQRSLDPDPSEAVRYVEEASIRHITEHVHAEKGKAAAVRARAAAADWWSDRRGDLVRKWKRSPAYGLDLTQNGF